MCDCACIQCLINNVSCWWWWWLRQHTWPGGARYGDWRNQPGKVTLILRDYTTKGLYMHIRQSCHKKSTREWWKFGRGVIRYVGVSDTFLLKRWLLVRYNLFFKNFIQINCSQEISRILGIGKQRLEKRKMLKGVKEMLESVIIIYVSVAMNCAAFCINLSVVCAPCA